MMSYGGTLPDAAPRITIVPFLHSNDRVETYLDDSLRSKYSPADELEVVEEGVLADAVKDGVEALAIRCEG